MKRNPNEPDNKAAERLREFNRQRQAVPGDNQEDTSAGKEKNKSTAPSTTEKDKKDVKNSPKKMK